MSPSARSNFYFYPYADCYNLKRLSICDIIKMHHLMRSSGTSPLGQNPFVGLANVSKGFVARQTAKFCLLKTVFQPHKDSLLPVHSESWPKSIAEPTDYYLNCTRYFYQAAPNFVRAHRKYFKKRQRGFGEDSFHVMWHALFENCRPKSFLEIGVYRGQVLSLVSLLAQQARTNCLVCGVSPFSSAGDSVSKYLQNLDYFEDTLANFRAFSLPPPQLIRGFSTDPDVTREFSSTLWDLVYIDGNHEYEIARQDFLNCSRCLAPGGKIVLDDSALGTPFTPPRYATAGHPGPSRLAQELPSFGFTEILQIGHNRVFQKST